VVLAGPPNAGKSTLFNALAGMQQALVSAEAGTTRDYLAAEIDLAGITVELVDTAGRIAALDGVEQQAQTFGQEQIERANLVVWCRAADQPAEFPIAVSDADARRGLQIITKGDLVESHDIVNTLLVSARSGRGLSELRAAISARLLCDGSDDVRLLGTTAARSFDSLNQARSALDRAVAIACDETDQELLAIEVRETLDELGKIAGVVYTDDILDRIFSKFCIGK
jgi:tRNA modification GTPase